MRNNRHEAAPRALSIAAVLAIGLGAAACGSQPVEGYDVSHPQCSTQDGPAAATLPNDRGFAIIGLNEGVGKTLNPCFEAQIDWADGLDGGLDATPAGIYVNSGNPGKDAAASWPTAGEFNGEQCDGQETTACAYAYGQTLAEWDIQAFNDTYGRSHDTKLADLGHVWIDAEWGNWECNDGATPECNDSDATVVEKGAFSRNTAVLAGMAAEFKAAGATVGIYTEPKHWGLITGNQVSQSPNTYASLKNADVWLTGAVNTEDARQLCQQALGGLGNVIMAQSVEPGSLDKDYTC